MLEKPELQEDRIISCLRERYGLRVCGVAFLPLGNDSTAWVYRVESDEPGRRSYFLKVKRGRVYEPALFVPRYLKDQEIEQVVAPLPTNVAGGDGRGLWARVDDTEFALILYPFVEGRTGMESGMSDEQWVELGRVLRRIHSSGLDAGLSRERLAQVRKEGFSPPWSGMVRRLEAKIQANEYDSCFEKQLASFWRERRDEIRQIVERAEELGRMLRRMLEGQSNEFVLCHADIHTANILLDQQDKMFIVDWDETILAPKERDLMFVVGDLVDGVAVGEKAELFFKGYGKTEINPLALAYYRYEWVVQEIGDYGERVFLMKDIGHHTKKDAVQGFIELFQPGDVVESAYASDKLEIGDWRLEIGDWRLVPRCAKDLRLEACPSLREGSEIGD